MSPRTFATPAPETVLTAERRLWIGLGIRLRDARLAKKWGGAEFALWSSEVLHALRLRPDSFRAVCPDPMDAFRQWWCGEPPRTGVTSTLVFLDPVARGGQRLFSGLDEALTARPRHRGYLDVVSLLSARAV